MIWDHASNWHNEDDIRAVMAWWRAIQGAVNQRNSRGRTRTCDPLL
jgi:hypothetical protein